MRRWWQIFIPRPVNQFILNPILGRRIEPKPPIDPIFPNPEPEPGDEQPENVDFQHQMLDLHNDYRIRLGRHVLAIDDDLAKCAQFYAKVMLDHSHFSHYGPNGSTPGSRAGQFGFHRAVRENIAHRYTTPEDVVEGWRSSRGHYASMISYDMFYAGFGRSVTYWVAMFGGE